MKSPFKFLDAYTLADRDVFFGRDEEVQQLFDMVNKNRLVLVYGQSGTGKTSLVQCGLAAQFGATDWLPVFVRRENNFNDSLSAALARALQTDNIAGNLREAVQAVYTRYLRPVYLIFDQFEELFILGDPEEQETFIRQIAGLYEGEASCQMLFIIREEYLAWLYDFEKTIPVLFDRRLRVEPMSAAKVKTVLEESFKRFNITLEDPPRNLQQIMDNIRGEKSVIQLPYLQVYLDQFWREDYDRTYTSRGIEPKNPKRPALTFETKEIKRFGAIGDVLAKYLDNQRLAIQDTLAATHTGLKGTEVARILDVFVTAKGTKRPVTFTRKGKNMTLHGIPEDALDDLPPGILMETLDVLEDNRILRINGNNLELAHDKLAELIENYRTDEDRKLESDRQLIEAAFDTHRRTGDYMSRKALLLVEDSLVRLKLREDQRRFIKESEAEALRQEDSEREAALQRARDAEEKVMQETRLRRLAERARNRLSLLSISIFAAGLIVVYFVRERGRLSEQIFAEKMNAQLAKSSERNALEAKVRADMALNRYYYGSLIFDLVDQDIENMQYEEAYNRLLAVFQIQAERDSISGKITAVDSLSMRPDLQGAFPKRRIAEILFEITFYFSETQKDNREKLLTDTIIPYLGYSLKKFNKNLSRIDSFLTTDSMSLRTFEDTCFAYCARKYFPVMRTIPEGSFEKGCNGQITPDCNADQLPASPKTVDSFLLAATEVTNHQYFLYLKATDRSAKEVSPAGWFLKGCNPVVRVDWYDAVSYANWLSERLSLRKYYNINKTIDPLNKRKKDYKKWQVSRNPAHNGFRLPTETEWEYAAKAGHNAHRFAGGDGIDSLGWCKTNGKNAIQAVASLKPNAFGLYDMSGNVWEWCWDWYHPNGYAISEDSLERTVKYARVYRGGSWRDPEAYCTVTNRGAYNLATLAYDDIKYTVHGFRVARNY